MSAWTSQLVAQVRMLRKAKCCPWYPEFGVLVSGAGTGDALLCCC